MLTHTEEDHLLHGRAVVIGSRGFLGRALCGALHASGVETLGLSSAQIDLRREDAADRLASRLQDGDRVLVLAGAPPAKPERTSLIVDNARLVRAVAQSIGRRDVAQVIYLSSDAVYGERETLLTEVTCASSSRPYGVSHRLREAVLMDTCADRLAVVRSTMVYGVGDPHAAYGPNRMATSALREGVIRLFGRGEDVRDYLAVDDLCRLMVGLLRRRSVGVINAASGEAVSAASVAGFVARAVGRPVRVECQPRRQEPSRRAFDIRALEQAFPGWRPVPLRRGLESFVADLRSGSGSRASAV